MAWDNGVSANGRAIFSETITLASTATVAGSSMDFIRKDDDFWAILNTGATNTTGAVTVDLEGSLDGTTWFDVDTSFAADLDTATVTSWYDSSATGDWPYYRMTFDTAGAAVGETIIVKILI